MSATSGGGGSVSEGSEAGGSTQSTMSVSDSPSTSFQTNLAENVTKITLSEENSVGSFGADVTGSKINLSLDERQQKDGIVNVAFDYEEGTNRGGDFKLINGSEKKDKVPEAVNLELVNMVPYSNGNGTSYGVPVNGIPTKKDSEQVDISTPYDEYFVPVNEHKKYMRGEKLYVTKDKRRPTSWRRCLSWIVASTVISIVLILAILAGTGVILSQEPNLVKEASVGRNFAGSNLKPSVTDKSHTTTAEMYMYVPRSIESEFVIDNLDFDPAFKNRNSSAYQQFATVIEDKLKMILFDKEILEFGASDVGLKVINISRDPFKVNYRIGWNYKRGVNDPPEPIKMEDVKKRLVESLARNQGYIDKYHIDKEAIKVNHVINTCQMDNGGCSHICYYNYVSQQFTCTCPTHLVLDHSDKNCVAWTSPSENDAVPIPSQTANPTHEYEFGAHYEHDGLQGTHYHSENEKEKNAEPSPEPGMKDSEIDEHREQEVVAEPEPTIEYSPNRKGGSRLDSEVKQVEQNVHSSNDSFDHGATPEPTPIRNTEDQYHAVSTEYESKKSTVEPGPEPTANSVSEDYDHVSHLVHEPKGQEPSAEPIPETMVDSSSGDYGNTSHSVFETKAQEPSAEPTSEATTNSDSGDQDLSSHSVYGFKEHEPSVEGFLEATPKKTELSSEGRSHDHDVHSVHKIEDDEPTPEPDSEPTAEFNSESKDHRLTHSVHITKAQEPTAEPTPELITDQNSNERKHEHADHSVHNMNNHESSAELTLEPIPESATKYNLDGSNENYSNHSMYELKEHELMGEPAPEQSTRLTAEYTSESKPRDHDGLSMNISKDHEPAGESILAPSSEPTSKFETKGKDHDSFSHSVYGSEDKLELESTAEPEPEPEPKPEPEPVPNSKVSIDNFDGHSQYESKNHGITLKSNLESTTEFNLPKLQPTYKFSESEPNRELKSKIKDELALKPTSEPSFENTSNSGTGDQNETTVDMSTQEGITNLETITLGNLNHKSVPLQEQLQITEYNTEQPVRVLHSLENKPDRIKSEHHVPYLEDILIRRPSPNLEKQNGTYLKQNPLDNVELMVNGQPVIEEILIDKSGTKSIDQVMPDQTGSTSNSNLSTEDTGIINRMVMGHSARNSTEAEHRNNLNMQNVQRDIVTDHPRIIEYIAGQYPAHEKEIERETEKIEYEQIGSSQGGLEVTTKSNDQDIFRSLPHLIDKNFETMTIKSDAEQKTMSVPQDNLAVTTVSSKIDQESRTIPVTVEFFRPSISKVNPEPKSKHDKPTGMSEIKFGEGEEIPENFSKNIGVFKGNGGFNETVHNITNNFSSSKTFRENETKVHETETESPITRTALVSVLTPDDKLNKDLVNKQDANEKTIEYKTNDQISQIDGNEGNKSPEEISNVIKDELPDNEEFNTLIEKEYKNKEGNPIESKETTKYPNKSFRPEKKKLKDYIKGERIESDKKAEVTVKPGVTPEDFILQKHVSSNENTFDLDYSLPNEQTTKHDGGITVIDPHGIEGVPGVSLKPHGINNHDISVLQTVAPDFRMETSFPNGGQELETLKPDFKNKFSDNKDGESKADKDYKFDKDYKYEKQKVSKKKDLKKKVGGKDGKNVELEEGRKYLTEITKDDWDVSQEVKGASETTISPLEKIMLESETNIKVISDDKGVTAVPESTSFRVKSDSPENILQSSYATKLDIETVQESGVTEHPSFKPENKQTDPNELKISEETTGKSSIKFQGADELNRHLMIDESMIKSTYNASTKTVYDEQQTVTESSDPKIQHLIVNTALAKEQETSGTQETVFDRITQSTTVSSVSDVRLESNNSTQDDIGRNTTFAVYENRPSISSITLNSTTAHPTIIIHGQSGNLQDGHILRFANSTLQSPPNATVPSIFNGTLNYPDSHSFSFTNHNASFPNGSGVQPTIVVRGQSGTLQAGHEARFANSTFQTFLTSSEQTIGTNRLNKNSDIYRIDNASLPGTVFDGHFNPQDGHYHMFTNTSGTFVYTNTSTSPTFIIKGESGDFGNATAYIIGNTTQNSFLEGFTLPQAMIFRNSTVFAVGNNESYAAGIQEITGQPYELSNETIHFTHQMSPSFVSSGTAYKVNNYFGYISKCAAGQFQCVNGTSKRGSACINLSSKCDSINDCSDGSDELGCIENGCPGNFQCADGTCLKRNLVCNGILDCSDGSDEKNCENWKCEFDEFQCPSGRCIPVVWQCDSKPDCDNHTDEYNCQTSCGNDEYLCPEGWCIPLTYKCNGIKECSNGEDEQLCDCSHEEFKCQTGGCVLVKQVCDGLDDCPDRSDEWDCVKLEPNSNLLKIRSASGNYEPVCADNWLPRYSDDVCASLGYFSSVPIENENSSLTTETSFYVLKNDTTANFNRKIIVNVEKSEKNCSSQKFVEISCQEFNCGSRSMTDSSSVEARLVGGMSATAGQWPSVTLLYNIRNFHSCTANVLTPRWVLASYNCLKMGNKIFNEQDWKFFGGSTIFEAERENAETRNIISIIPHPQVKFNQFLFTNDLALIELDQSLQFTSNLGAVCLPEQEMQPRQICVTAGWGINSPEDKAMRQQLQYLPVPTMNLTECNSTEHYSGFITDDKICAGYNSAQKSLCYNEEGAPLMCVNDKGEWELQGVLSYQSNCGRGSHPSIFGSITSVTDWIKKTIGNSFQRKASALSNR